MRIFYFYRKRVFVFFLILATLGIIIGIFTICRLPQKHETNTNIETYQVIKQSEEEGLVQQKEAENINYVKGKDILEKYSEVRGTDYAILIATTAYLEADSDVIAAETEYPYIKYVIDQSRQNIAETILDSNNVQVTLSFVNYNAVLKDSCIFHKEGSNMYETPNGFMEEDIIVEGLSEAEDVDNITYKAVFPLKNSKNNLNYINNQALFYETYLINMDSKVIGSIYIEQGGTQ